MVRNLLVAALAATVLVVVASTGPIQEAETQTENQESSAAERPTYPPVSTEEFAPRRMLVKLEERTPRIVLDNANRRNNARVEERIPGTRVEVIRLPRDLPVREAVRRYEALPDVEYAEPDFLLYPTLTPNDPDYPRLYGLDNTGQTGGTPGADVSAKEAWDTTTGAPDTVVAVIDEGVDVEHPDLRDNIWVNPGEVPANRRDDDGNGYVDDVNGYDFANDDASVYDPDPLTGRGDEHGTHVAGTIAAEGNNDTGVTGINWRAAIMVLKFLGPKGGYTSDAVEALGYAVENGARISNNSWGGGGKSQALQDAISRADASGHLFVAAAGNNGTSNDATPYYPASYPGPNIVSVAATNDRDALASFSNYGASSVDLAAPGVSILSTLPNNRYGNYSGTSMATPHVAGVAALLRSRDPSVDDEQLKARILDYADPTQSLQGKTATGGRLNAEASLTQRVAADDTSPTITDLKPGPASSIRSRTPTIKAKVTDNRTDLARTNLRLYLDGKQRTRFSYDRAANQLSYKTPRLSYARHAVKLVAEDAAGNTATRKWSFKVRR